jgi:hypothetical protein
MPSYLDLIPDGIPPELRVQPFVLWRATPNPEAPDKPKKVPYQIRDPRYKASATDPRTWGSFPDAVDAFGLLSDRYRAHPTDGPIAGIAVILTAAARIFCLDLDRVLEGTTLHPAAARLVAAYDSFTEISPSGTGLHIFGRGEVHTAVRGDQVELYGDARMICLSGWRWPGTPFTLASVQPLLDRLMTASAPAVPRPRWTGPASPPPDDLGGALLAKVAAWQLEVAGPLKRWHDGFLIELARCPWAHEHTTGAGGAAILIRASGAYDFTCRHAHCGGRDWRAFRGVMETRS